GVLKPLHTNLPSACPIYPEELGGRKESGSSAKTAASQQNCRLARSGRYWIRTSDLIDVKPTPIAANQPKTTVTRRNRICKFRLGLFPYCSRPPLTPQKQGSAP